MSVCRAIRVISGMPEIRTATTLRYKEAEIAAAIDKYEAALTQAKLDLAHVRACIVLFEASGDPRGAHSYVDTHRLYRRKEMSTIAKAALAKEGPLTTRELSARILQAKGLDGNDAVLVKSISQRVIHILRMQAQRGTIKTSGKRKGVSVWALP